LIAVKDERNENETQRRKSEMKLIVPREIETQREYGGRQSRSNFTQRAADWERDQWRDWQNDWGEIEAVIGREITMEIVGEFAMEIGVQIGGRD
jgi:hypothetical protein